VASRFNLEKTKDRAYRAFDESSAKFRNFLRTTLFDKFISTSILYFVAYFQHSTIAKKPGLHSEAKLQSLKHEMEERMDELGPLYSKILLTQSDYVHTQQDKVFFESLYEACHQILLEAFAGQRKSQELEIEMGRIFRTEHFNIAHRRHENRADPTQYTVRQLYELKNGDDIANNSRILSSIYSKRKTKSVGALGTMCSPIITRMLPKPWEEFQQKTKRKADRKAAAAEEAAETETASSSSLDQDEASDSGTDGGAQSPSKRGNQNAGAHGAEGVVDENLAYLEGIRRELTEASW